MAMNDNRRIRVFVSSTFRDMMGERDELMTHAWPELRRFCRERQVELVEVDLRWGIAEEQSTRKETLKLCLDEIRACRPFFIGLLGERYGWVPGDDAFTADLKEEQPWLNDLHGKSVTELEILHGVLNNPDMAGRAFFYFRDPKYVESVPQDKKADFTAEDTKSAEKQTQLKNLIRQTCAAKKIPLRENYPDPLKLAALVLEDLKAAIEAQFPIENIPDALTREARDHEAFAETRRRTYIGRPDYFVALDRHAAGDDAPLVLLGDSGSGKSALLANWLAHWHRAHPKHFIFQHYIGGTPDSAEHWRLMTRLIAEIKRWTDDPEELPKSHDDLLKTFPVWLAKARIKAERDGVRCILVLDALNQLEDRDHARLLGWLPSHAFTGALRLVVSTLPGDTLEAVTPRGWKSLCVEPLTSDERRRMIEHYLARFGKKLDAPRLERIAAAPATANPLYLKILLDELCVTGTYDRLDERLNNYLAATDIPALLKKVLARYQHDYERDRKGLVSEALGLIWAARRGLTETELLRLLRAKSESGNQKSEISGMPQLPPAIWNPLRSALEEGLVDRGGILNFAHDFLRTAVADAFVPDQEQRDDLRLQLADDFEQQPVSARSCDELPWLLWQANQRDRLRACLLDIDRFLEIRERDQEELMRYWVWLKEERVMGQPYLQAFELWASGKGETTGVSHAANQVALFLSFQAALHAEAEPLYRRAISILWISFGENHPGVATALNNLAQLLQTTNRLAEAEPLMRRALVINEKNFGLEHPDVARNLNNLAELLRVTNRLAEAEPLYRRALAIFETSFGLEDPKVATGLNNLALLLQATNRLAEAEPLMRRAISILEKNLGENHPDVATALNNLAQLLLATNRLAEAEPLMRRVLAIFEKSSGAEHPQVAVGLNNLAALLQATNRLAEAEPLMRRALAIDEKSYGPEHPNVARDLSNLAVMYYKTDRLPEAEPLMGRVVSIFEKNYGSEHPNVATSLNNLAELLRATNRFAEAEPLYRRALAIDELSFGPEHFCVARDLNNLALLLYNMKRLREVEPLMRRALAINEKSFGQEHPEVATSLNNLAALLQATNRLAETEPLIRRALAIDEKSFGSEHPNVARDLGTLAALLQATKRLVEAEPLMRRHLEIFLKFTVSTGHQHPHFQAAIENYAGLLSQMGRNQPEVLAQINAIGKPFGIQLGGGS
jgi:nephrocystin-3